MMKKSATKLEVLAKLSSAQQMRPLKLWLSQIQGGKILPTTNAMVGAACVSRPSELLMA